MMDTITLTIPTAWLEGVSLDQEELRQALKLGLSQLRQQQSLPEASQRVIQTLLNTGRVRPLASLPPSNSAANIERQPPPVLAGPPTSHILIAQRRGEE